MSPLTTRFTALPTAAVSDALDALGLPGALLGIGPLTNAARAVGPAYTVRYEPIIDEPGTVGDFLDDVPAGAVIVIDNAGRTDCTVWGGIMTAVASANGVAGTVVHGACRDVASAIATALGSVCTSGPSTKAARGQTSRVFNASCRQQPAWPCSALASQ
jgi:4-hydroxy-4-methyl-2-oxoglutarate aldolase